MKLSNTKMVKAKSLIKLSDEVYLKTLPMKEMIDIISSVDADPELQEAAINNLFDTLIVDPKGNKFEDLKDGNATEILPMPVIMDIMTRMTEVLNPAGK